MLTKIFIEQDSELSNRIHFKEMTPKRLNLLCGGNGVGKSTLLRGLANVARKGYKEKPDAFVGMDADYIALAKDSKVYKYEGICTVANKATDCLTYFDSVDNASVREVGFNPYLIKQKFDAQIISEGESILYSFSDLLYALARTDKDSPFPITDKDYVVLIDEIDSGMSLDHVDEVCKAIEKLLSVRDDVQIFMSFNNYHFAYFFDEVFSMYTGEYKSFKGISYRSFLKFLKDNSGILKENHKLHKEEDDINFKEFINPYDAVKEGIKISINKKEK